ncbi:hypothetical protein MUK42_19007 [Musa troglodytarum]|uniref:Uncharacterized protein n=1 Tax=Musa troglodytarum TaxID=320322 RepID=A0A9E7ENM6_9LILI|nr:hypothetical protein MUK42_19007 [Musa troglodytarum]URD79910.1 hypothetical protein MUK42_19007 [Musa troglodytarum]URD79911.1 hypothetical protein MUK42_19007 [Musa troglodytarum]URD79912.1 hypothetical protein MUK42_19007 [Musa troglodytarum]
MYLGPVALFPLAQASGGGPSMVLRFVYFAIALLRILPDRERTETAIPNPDRRDRMRERERGLLPEMYHLILYLYLSRVNIFTDFPIRSFLAIPQCKVVHYCKLVGSLCEEKYIRMN